MFKLDQTLPISKQVQLIVLQMHTDTLPIVFLSSAKIGELVSVLSQQLQDEDDQGKHRIYKKYINSLSVLKMRKENLQESGQFIQMEPKRNFYQSKVEHQIYEKKIANSAELVNKTEKAEKLPKEHGKVQQSFINKLLKSSLQVYASRFHTKKEVIKISDGESQEQEQKLIKKKHI